MDFIKDNWAEILTMIGGILTALFGLVIMIIEHNSLTPNKKTFGLLLCVAGGLTASGTYFSSISNNDNQKKLILANKSIDSLTKINTNLSFSNSSKLDLSLNRLESIIDKSNSQIGKLDIVQKDMITNYKKITKETKIIQDKTASLKYLISNNFYLDLQIHFKSKFLSDYIKTYIKNDSFGFVFFKNENYNKSFYYQIVANTLIKNFNKDFVIGIEILEEKRRASDSIVIMIKFF